ncbi:MAG: phage tail tube protein [Bacillota bacterium]
MGDEVISGILSYASYGYETTFGVKSTDSVYKPFGHGFKISTLSKKNNVSPLYTLGGIEATTLPAMHYEGSVSVEFTPGNAYWLHALTGNTETVSGTGPYIHKYIDTVASKPIAPKVSPITIENAMNVSTTATDVRTFLKGCSIKSSTVSAAVGEMAKVTMEMDYANEEKDSTYGTPVFDTYSEPFSYQHGKIKIPAATELIDVQSFELTINRNTEMVRGLGSRFATHAPVKNVEYDFRATVMFENAGLLEKFYGGTYGPVQFVSPVADCEFTFDNTLTGIDNRKIELKFTGLQIDEFSIPQDVGDLLKQDISGKLRVWTMASYTDNTVNEPT